VEPVGTVTDPGTFTAPLLLVKLTSSPLLPAAPLSTTVHASLPPAMTEL